MFKTPQKKFSKRTSRIEINKSHDSKIVDNGRVSDCARAEFLARTPLPKKVLVGLARQAELAEFF